MCWEGTDGVGWSAKCVLSVRGTGGHVLELLWLLGRFRTSVLLEYLLEGDDGGSIERIPKLRQSNRGRQENTGRCGSRAQARSLVL
jgi:hypothetical protein